MAFRRWMQSLDTMALRSQYQCLTGLRCWLRWLCELGELERVPVQELRMVKRERRLPREVLAVEEIGLRARLWVRRYLEQTRVYTHVSQTRAKEVHARCHPLERQNVSWKEGLH